MPFINTKVSVEISSEQELKIKEELGKAITLLGKSESWLMLSFEDNCRMYFKGNNNSPTAFVDVQLFGKAQKSAYDKMTAKVTEIISEILKIPGDRIYVKYGEVDTWGWSGSNF